MMINYYPFTSFHPIRGNTPPARTCTLSYCCFRRHPRFPSDWLRQLSLRPCLAIRRPLRVRHTPWRGRRRSEGLHDDPRLSCTLKYQVQVLLWCFLDIVLRYVCRPCSAASIQLCRSFCNFTCAHVDIAAEGQLC